jgi:hypothetical protein
MRLSMLPRLLVALGCVALMAACGEGGSSTTGISGGSAYPATVDGTYSATTMTLTEAGGSTDLLAEGVVISLVLAPGGATTGTMTVPASYSESGEEEILSLNGTYTYDATTGIVTFAHAADTFLRDTTWHAKGTQLKGTFDGGTYSLTVTLETGT